MSGFWCKIDTGEVRDLKFASAHEKDQLHASNIGKLSHIRTFDMVRMPNSTLFACVKSTFLVVYQVDDLALGEPRRTP
jgi:hypothetical protein